MSTTVGAGPVPLSRVWSRGKVLAEDLTGDDLGDVLLHQHEAYAWWVLPRDDYGRGELRRVARELDLDEAAQHDLLAPDRRVKFEAIGSARLVSTVWVGVDEARLDLQQCPVSMIATERVLICLVEPGHDFRPEKLLAGPGADLTGGVESGFQLLVRHIVASYQDTVDWLETTSDALSDVLFDSRPLRPDEQLDAFRLRRALTRLRRVTEPMRDVLDDLADDPPPPPKGAKPVKGAQTSRIWRMTAEHHVRVADRAASLREVLASIFDTNLSLADVRMNTIMKKLTGWAAIIAVPTLVTGFVGQNVEFPLDGTTSGFWLYLVIMVAAAVVLFVFFRRRDWI